jgi:hypothetical protein
MVLGEDLETIRTRKWDFPEHLRLVVVNVSRAIRAIVAVDRLA